MCRLAPWNVDDEDGRLSKRIGRLTMITDALQRVLGRILMDDEGVVPFHQVLREKRLAVLAAQAVHPLNGAGVGRFLDDVDDGLLERSRREPSDEQSAVLTLVLGRL